MNLNLERLCLIEVAGQLCSKSEVVEEIMIIYLKKKSSKFEKLVDAKNNSAVNLVLNNINTLSLPEKILRKLTDIIILFIRRILSWVKFVETILQLDLRFGNQIFWTPNGFIDEEKIFNSWLNVPGFCEIKRPMGPDKQNVTVSFLLACILVQENFIERYKDRMVQEIKKLLPVTRKQNCKFETSKIIAVYLIFCYGKGLEKSFAKSKSYNKLVCFGKISLQDVTCLCGFYSFIRAFKYFWNVLTEKDKNEVKIMTVDMCIRGAGNWNSGDFDWIQRCRSAQVLLFLNNNMANENKLFFWLKNTAQLFEIFLTVWPYEETLVKIRNDESLAWEFMMQESGFQIKDMPSTLYEGNYNYSLSKDYRKSLVEMIEQKINEFNLTKDKMYW